MSACPPTAAQKRTSLEVRAVPHPDIAAGGRFLVRRPNEVIESLPETPVKCTEDHLAGLRNREGGGAKVNS
jgi:hypothetical protein